MERDGLVVCPECDGRKRGMVHLNTSSGGRWEEMKCRFCDSFGWVQREKCDRWREGEAMREDRKRRIMTLRDEAARLGITAKELSDREWGRKDH